MSEKARRYSDDECYENLVVVWTHYGRKPTEDEMRLPPSVVGPTAYTNRWRTWRRALAAFVAWTEVEQPAQVVAVASVVSTAPQPATKAVAVEDRHEIPLRLKWKVHLRDRFRCVACGRSPAAVLGVELHADHITPWADGGKTVLENLQTLCKDCNLGKGRSFGRAE